MHLECRDAMDREIKEVNYWDYEFLFRDNPRGKTIAEKEDEQYQKTRHM